MSTVTVWTSFFLTFALASVVEPVMDVEEAVVVSILGTDIFGLAPELVDGDAEASSMLPCINGFMLFSIHG